MSVVVNENAWDVAQNIGECFRATENRYPIRDFKL